MEIFEHQNVKGLVKTLNPRNSEQKNRWYMMSRLNERGLSFDIINTLICSFPLRDIADAISRFANNDYSYHRFEEYVVKICEKIQKKRSMNLSDISKTKNKAPRRRKNG